MPASSSIVSTGQALGLHPDVDCLTFTGSTATGKRFLDYASRSNMKLRHKQLLTCYIQLIKSEKRNCFQS